LPHRYPFLLIDTIEEIVKSDRIVAKKNVTMNEQFFQGHFPGKPVMPGVLIIEAMAQASGILALESNDNLKEGNIVYFLSIENAKFRIPVVPGNSLMIHSRALQFRGSVCRFECEALVDERRVAEAIICAKVVV
jgi:3-hydroxyacyl-[acyl-carrier-protein] dehydratase